MEAELVTLMESLLEESELARRGAALRSSCGTPAAPTFCSTACGIWIVPVCNQHIIVFKYCHMEKIHMEWYVPSSYQN